MRLVYEKKTSSIQFLILHLIIRCAVWSRKYGNHKINLITYLACAYPQHGGGEEVIIRINATKYWLLFQDINWNCATALSILVIKVNFSVAATCVFYLSWPINWTSPWTFNCRNSDYKIADLEHLRSVYSVRYFLGYYMWPFKLYHFRRNIQ